MAASEAMYLSFEGPQAVVPLEERGKDFDALTERVDNGARNQLDFVYTRAFLLYGQNLVFKFSVENLLNDRYLYTQGGETQERYTTGTVIGRLSASAPRSITATAA